MEVEQEKAVWLNPSHPNHERWRMGRILAGERAKVVKEIVSAHKICKGLNILDLGSGEGGTSSVFAGSNNTISYDLSLLRLKTQKKSAQNYSLINGNAGFLPFRNSSFDLIILQDVIEHIEDCVLSINEFSRILRNDGIIYLSTPNKYSLLNIISDPHWGIPFLSLFRRTSVKKYFLKFLRKADFIRTDTAELLSIQQLKKLFSSYDLQIKTKEIVQIVSEDPKGILWSSLHLFLYNSLKRSGLFFILNKIANNRSGFINNVFTPTFYIVLTKTEIRPYK